MFFVPSSEFLSSWHIIRVAQLHPKPVQDVVPRTISCDKGNSAGNSETSFIFDNNDRHLRYSLSSGRLLSKTWPIFLINWLCHPMKLFIILGKEWTFMKVQHHIENPPSSPVHWVLNLIVNLSSKPIVFLSLSNGQDIIYIYYTDD